MGVVGHPGKADERRADVKRALEQRALHHLGGGEEWDRANKGVATHAVVVVEEMPLAADTVGRTRGPGRELQHIDRWPTHDEHPQRPRAPLADDVSRGVALKHQPRRRRDSENRQEVPPLTDVLAVRKEGAHARRLHASLPGALHRIVEAGVGHQSPCAERGRQADEAVAGVEVTVVLEHLISHPSRAGKTAPRPREFWWRRREQLLAVERWQGVDRLGRR